MQCTRVERLPQGEDWLYEIKQDGYRVIALVDGKSAFLYSMSGVNYGADFPHIIGYEGVTVSGGFTKLFGSIIGSTVWREDSDTKVVWVTLLVLSDRDGVVEAAVPGGSGTHYH